MRATERPPQVTASSQVAAPRRSILGPPPGPERLESTAKTQPLDGGSADAQTTEVRPSVVTAIGEQCTECGAVLAPDQRYCVECGHRRGDTRAPFVDALTQPKAQAAAPPPPRRVRMSGSATLIAGVGTLLLALGVGVLIGRTGHNPKSAATPSVITVQGGGGAAAGTTAASNTPTPSSSGSKKNKSAKSSNGSAAAALGKGAKPPPKAVVTVGAPGHGPGYQKGKFTGNFFGQ